MRYENDGTGERDVTAASVFKAMRACRHSGNSDFGYNSANEQLDVRYVRVRKTDGSVVTAGPDAITDMTAPVARDAPVYTDFKEKHVTVPDLAPGVTLEYETVTRLVTPLAPSEFWFDHNFVKSSIVLDEQLEISVPGGRKIDLQSSPQTPYEMVSKDGRTIYTWKQSNLKLPSDDDAKKQQPRDAEAKIPDVQLTTFTSWEAVGKWYAKLEQGRTDPSPEIRAKTAALIARPHHGARKNPGAVQLRLEKHPLREPFLRRGPLPAAYGRRNFREPVWRLQGQAHAACFHAQHRRHPVRRRPDFLRAQI